MDELKTCRLDDTIENYHFKIKKIRNKLHNRKLTSNASNFTAEEINRIALDVFNKHLPELTKTMIFARNPATMEDAFKEILEAHPDFTKKFVLVTGKENVIADGLIA